ncbi:MAG TPA: hypothetical protein VEZ15_12365 [Acidimicrobiia bacterium]|nr:hypothetical protein [Acidimicrobiia bacterium]
MDDHTEPPAPIGWPRALLTTAIIVVVGIGVLVYGSNAVLTKFHGKTRSSLVGGVTPLFFIFLLALAWALRQLQRRKII